MNHASPQCAGQAGAGGGPVAVDPYAHIGDEMIAVGIGRSVRAELAGQHAHDLFAALIVAVMIFPLTVPLVVDRTTLVSANATPPCAPNPAICQQAAPNGSLTARRITWRAGTDYDLTDKSLLFFNVSTGYKQGGLDANQPPTNASDASAPRRRSLPSFALDIADLGRRGAAVFVMSTCA